MATVNVIREMAAIQIDLALAGMPAAEAATFAKFSRRIVDAIMDTLPLCQQPQVAFQGGDCLIYGPQFANGKDIDDTLVTVVVNKAGTTRTITDYSTGRIVRF